jgi:hypothetical protein
VLVAGISGFRQRDAQSPVPSAQFLQDWIEYDTFVWLINEEIVDEYKELPRGIQRLGEGAATDYNDQHSGVKWSK